MSGPVLDPLFVPVVPDLVPVLVPDFVLVPLRVVLRVVVLVSVFGAVSTGSALDATGGATVGETSTVALAGGAPTAAPSISPLALVASDGVEGCVFLATTKINMARKKTTPAPIPAKTAIGGGL